MSIENCLWLVVCFVALVLLRKVHIRLQLSRAKHPSLKGHSKWMRRISKQITYFEYDQNQFFCSDKVPSEIATNRRKGFESLQLKLATDSPDTIAFNESLASSISDVLFTSMYRVPFPFRQYLSKAMRFGSIVTETQGVKIKDIDDNWRFDLSGSYGVNVFGYDFYKDCMAKGFAKVEGLGPVLGPYHPLIRENVEILKDVSGLDEVSFHMSGTEAVMQAVRLARYHTGKSHLVRFCGAYHGWWDGVQPGIGNQRRVDDVYTLAEHSRASLKVLETRTDIACVLINPLQGLHPNSDSASDSTLISSNRTACFDRVAHSAWLQQVRDVCTRKNIVLIFDEVFTGFRLAYRGAQEYYAVQADIVTYGKTLGGGLPIGVVCGRASLMKRYKPKQPVHVSFARGTFNSHPYVLAAMNEFLKQVQQDKYQAIYQRSDSLWNSRVVRLNQRLSEADVPVKFANLQSVLTTLYTRPCRYNWMFQFYLRAEGLELSWVGSGRLIMSLNYSDEDFALVIERIVRAGQKMQIDDWWWQSSTLSNKRIGQRFAKDMFIARFPMLSKLTLFKRNDAGSTVRGAAPWSK